MASPNADAFAVSSAIAVGDVGPEAPPRVDAPSAQAAVVTDAAAPAPAPASANGAAGFNLGEIVSTWGVGGVGRAGGSKGSGVKSQQQPGQQKGQQIRKLQQTQGPAAGASASTAAAEGEEKSGPVPGGKAREPSMSEVESRARSYVQEKEAKAAQQPEPGTAGGRGNNGAVGRAAVANRSPGARKGGTLETEQAPQEGGSSAADDAASAAAGSESGNPFVAGPDSG